MKSLLYALLVSACFINAGPALRAEDRSIESTVMSSASCTADFLLERPAGLCLTATGTIAFFVTLPFSILGKNVSETAEKFIARPFRYTFTRPLGHFED